MKKISSKYVIGLMAGTSVDGLDICLVKINPDFSFDFIGGKTYGLPKEYADEIKSLFGYSILLEKLCWLNFVTAKIYVDLIKKFLDEIDFSLKKVDLIASHGQTVFHKVDDESFLGYSKNSTLQIGEPAIIAQELNKPVVADFRTADIAAGGQGAPLVSFFDVKFFSKFNKNISVHNIGGISNLTVVSDEIEPFAFDTGSGNVLIDYFVKKFFDKDFDKDGEIARAGKVNQVWLDELMGNDYFEQKPPKSTGRELFSYEYAEQIIQMPSSSKQPQDILATMNALTAKSIAKAYKDFVLPKVKIEEIIFSGGGVKNIYLMDLIRKELPEDIKIKTHADYGVSNDFKEAIAFAFLGYANFFDIPNNIPSCTGAKKEVVLGKSVR